MKGIIIEEVAKITIPIIQIIGVYVILFGHISPGGGFAGGTIIAISLILNSIVLDKKMSFNTLLNLQIIALMMYVLLKGYSILDSNMHLGIINISKGTPGNILSSGLILPLNIIVGIVVCISIYFIFSFFLKGEV